MVDGNVFGFWVLGLIENFLEFLFFKFIFFIVLVGNWNWNL